jgi:DNA repair protein RadC
VLTLFECKVLDHLIICEGSYLSLADDGLIS